MIVKNHRIDRLCISYVYVDSLSTVVYTLKRTQLCSHFNFHSESSWLGGGGGDGVPIFPPSLLHMAQKMTASLTLRYIFPSFKATYTKYILDGPYLNLILVSNLKFLPSCWWHNFKVSNLSDSWEDCDKLCYFYYIFFQTAISPVGF
jgi:hypothetical protein